MKLKVNEFMSPIFTEKLNNYYLKTKISPQKSSLFNVKLSEINNFIDNKKSSNINLTKNFKSPRSINSKTNLSTFLYSSNKNKLLPKIRSNVSIVEINEQVSSPIKHKKSFTVNNKLKKYYKNSKQSFNCKCSSNCICNINNNKQSNYGVKCSENCNDIYCSECIKLLLNKNIKNYDKKNIIQNIYFKNEKYYYSNNVNFESIIYNIYYEGCKLEELKEYILPAFKKITLPQFFFEKLFIESKKFGDYIKNILKNKINKVNGIINNKKIIKIINLLYEFYKSLESINFEIEKLTKIYLENFLENSQLFSFDTFLFHRKMFINRVYNDNVIHAFIIKYYNYFKNSYFNQSNYEKTLSKLIEIYETLEQISNNIFDNCQNHKINQKSQINKKDNIIEIKNKKNKKKNKQRNIEVKSTYVEIEENHSDFLYLENFLNNNEIKNMTRVIVKFTQKEIKQYKININ